MNTEGEIVIDKHSEYSDSELAMATNKDVYLHAHRNYKSSVSVQTTYLNFVVVAKITFRPT